MKNWREFQHFRSGDRHVIWIKLYRKILDDLEWHALDGDTAKGLVMLWLLASEKDGELPDLKTIAFRLRMSEAKCKSLISNLSHWLDQDDIKPISNGYKPDDLDKEEEEDKEKRREEIALTPSGVRAIGSGEVLITIPDNKGQEIPICKGFVDELEKAYPIVDALQTLREIRAWTIANKAKRKTASGMSRFVQSWFAREQNRG